MLELISKSASEFKFYNFTSTGEVMTKPVCSLILSARDVRNQEDTVKLLKWKNAHESFEWTAEEPAEASKTSSETATEEQHLEGWCK